jgi:hypothetical protein
MRDDRSGTDGAPMLLGFKGTGNPRRTLRAGGHIACAWEIDFL